MAAPFSISEARLVSGWLTTIFWSFFFVTFVQCLRALLMDEWRIEFRRRSAINWPMVCVAVAFFVFGTSDCVLGFYHNVKAFILFKGPGGAEAEFNRLSDWVNVMKGINLCMQTLIGDGVLIFRLWIVYNRSWRVISVPVLLWLGTTACAIAIIFGEITTVTPGTIGSSNIKDFIIPLWTCSMTLNIVATSLLVKCIIQVDRQNSKNGVVLSFSSYLSSRPNSEKKRRSRLQRISYIIIESGLMYTLMALITFISVLVSNSNAGYITADVEVQIVGIAFNLIIIRVANRGPKDKALYTVQQHQIQPLQFNKSASTASDTTLESVHVIVERDTDTRQETETGYMRSTESLRCGLSSEHGSLA